MEVPVLTDVLQRSSCPRFEGIGGTLARCPELDPAAHGVLLPQKIQPFLLNAHGVSSLSVMIFVPESPPAGHEKAPFP